MKMLLVIFATKPTNDARNTFDPDEWRSDASSGFFVPFFALAIDFR